MQLKKILLAGLVSASLTTAIFTARPLQASGGNKCMMAVTYSEMAYGQFKKAYKTASADDIKKWAKKGMDQIKQASAYAAQCSCTTAETYSLTAYAVAKKALETSAPDDLKVQIKKAMDLSLDAMGAAQKCQ